MLKNIPPIISPELLSVLNEMGHGDRICIGVSGGKDSMLTIGFTCLPVVELKKTTAFTCAGESG